MTAAMQWYRIVPGRERDSAHIAAQARLEDDETLRQAEAAVSLQRQVFTSDAQGRLSLLLLDDAATALKLQVSIDAGGRYQHLSPFWLGGRLHLLAYRRQDGVFDFFQVTGRTFERLHRFQRSYGDATDGFTTIHAYAYRGQCLFMGYNAASGMSRIYALQVPPRQALSVAQLWQSQWSEDWRHFCFFQLGEENFFFKINSLREKVNIDHYFDDPAQGAYAVASQLPFLSQVSAAATLELAEGPGFAAYQAQDGLLSVNRFASDCQGWRCQGQQQAKSGSGSMLAIALDSEETLLALY